MQEQPRRNISEVCWWCLSCHENEEINPSGQFLQQVLPNFTVVDDPHFFWVDNASATSAACPQAC